MTGQARSRGDDCEQHADDEEERAASEGLLGAACEQQKVMSTLPLTEPYKAKLAAVCYFTVGAALLAPWNAYLTAIDYFSAVYGAHMDRLFTMCYMPTCLLLLLLMLHLGPRWAPFNTRITIGLVGFVAVTILMPLVDTLFVAGRSEAPTSALGVVLAAVVATGILDGISQGAAFVDAAQSGPLYTHATVGGTACSGVLICLLRLSTKAAFPKDSVQALRESTAVYFAAAAALSAAGLLSHLVFIPRLGVRPAINPGCAGKLGQLELVAGTGGGAHAQGNETAGSREGGASRMASIDLGDDDDEEEDDEERVPVTPAVLFGRQRYTQVHNGAAPGRPAPPSFSWPWAASASEACGRRRQHEHEATLQRYRRLACVGRHCWPSLACLFITYTTTLSVFPGVLAEDIQSGDMGDWLPLLLISLFNVSDAVGKLAPIHTSFWAHRQRWLLFATLTRLLLLLPALVLSAAFSAPIPAIAALTSVFGLTNGYLTALAMTLAPSFVTQAQRQALDPSGHGSDGRPPSPPRPWPVPGIGSWLGGATVTPIATRSAPAGGPSSAVSQYVSLGAIGRSDSGGGLMPSPRFARTAGHSPSHVAGPEHTLALGTGAPGIPVAGHGAATLRHHHHAPDAGPSVATSSKWSARRADGGLRGGSVSSSTTSGSRQGEGCASGEEGRLQSDADMAEDLCVVSLVSGLTVGAMTAWLWLLLPRSGT